MTTHPEGEPWQWPESTWRRIVGRASGGIGRQRELTHQRPAFPLQHPLLREPFGADQDHLIQPLGIAVSAHRFDAELRPG